MKERDSNIELLRIVAMILVMIVHASFLAIGVPQTIDAMSHYRISTYYSVSLIEATVCSLCKCLYFDIRLVWNKH
jgi:hypothetical protein